MNTKQRRIWIVGAVLVLVAIAATIWIVGGSAEEEEPQPATEQQMNEFRGLHQTYVDVFSAARVTGDVSKFPTLFYNDPDFDVSKEAPDCMFGIDRYADQIASLLASHGLESQVGRPGILSCSIADILYLHESAAAWDAVQAQAQAEGRSPSITEMPEGLQPVELPGPEEQSIHTDSYLQEASVQGNHATVKFSFDPSGGGRYEHLLLINRDGTWYISGIWNSGQP